MTVNASAPWHKESFDKFLRDDLPALLAQRLPLGGYQAEPAGPYACRVTVTVCEGASCATAVYELPQPNAEGVFDLQGRLRVVVPTASSEDLESAQVKCVGRQLYEHVDHRLGKAPAAMEWDGELLRSFLPLDEWIRQFLSGQAGPRHHSVLEYGGDALPTSQELDEQNWLSRRTHLRRIMIPGRRRLIAPGQFGRTCPFETPEGNNIGRVLSLAVGAAIRDGRIVMEDSRPQAALGLTASMVPFLEHNDPNRQLMGVNMMRQAVVPADPEPALVQTGNEPDEPAFWCGRNMLTAFVSWGAQTYEDAVIVSQSAARRLGFPNPLQCGDKLSNRHGAKGTVSAILPDDQMPHLADGTPVELVYSFLGLHSRGNFGQVREAVMGRLARCDGKPAIVPPFGAPSAEQLRRRLAQAGLNESGMEHLTLGRGGKILQRPSTIGWVYWYKLHHLATEKLVASMHPSKGCMLQGQLEYFAMREAGAFAVIGETYNLRSADHPEAATLLQRVAAGPVAPAQAPSPKLTALAERLTAAGIAMELTDGKLTFGFRKPERSLELACPVPHPWLSEQELTEVGVLEGHPGLEALTQANQRAQRLLGGDAPPALRQSAREQLRGPATDYLNSLLDQDSLRFHNRVVFSGKSVLSVGPGLRLDQVGLPEQIAWTLYEPLLVRHGVASRDMQDRTPKAAKALDEIMAASWILLNRAPTIGPTGLLAFHPVRHGDRVIRIHPLVCYLMNADFDGDQAGVFLPVTEAGQQEAGQRLSIAGHLRRDPALAAWLAPNQEMLWGLAALSLTPKGMAQIADLLGVEPAAPDGYVTRQSLAEEMRKIMDKDGPEAVLDAASRLMQRGFEMPKASGASISPFLGESLSSPPAPATDDQAGWELLSQQLAERIESAQDFANDDLGPQLLAVRSGARGSTQHLVNLLGPRGTVQTPESPDPAQESGPRVIIRHGLVRGLSPQEMWACTTGARVGLGQVALDCAQAGYGIVQAKLAKGFNVLGRAMRAANPGIVFARAAATGQTDPLTDLDSRLFAGLGPA